MKFLVNDKEVELGQVDIMNILVHIFKVNFQKVQIDSTFENQLDVKVGLNVIALESDKIKSLIGNIIINPQPNMGYQCQSMYNGVGVQTHFNTQQQNEMQIQHFKYSIQHLKKQLSSPHNTDEMIKTLNFNINQYEDLINKIKNSNETKVDEVEYFVDKVNELLINKLEIKILEK